jgi:SAM-dependent methyltransferase
MKIVNTPQKLVRFEKMVKLMKKGSVLDIGCNRPNPYLNDAVGIDYLNVPKHSNYKKIVKADVNKGLPFKDNSFDNVLAGEIIEHLDNPLGFVKECYRILKPKGKLILTTPNVYYYLGLLFRIFRDKPNPDHIIEIPHYSLKKLFQLCGFKKTKVEGIFFVIPLLRKIVKTKSLFWSKIIISAGVK